MLDKLYTSLVFADLRKAFDTVCQQTLLIKLQRFGIREAIYVLISSHFYGRNKLLP